MDLKKQQAAITVDEQIENLKSIGLVINDEEYAQHFLSDVSYYRLIKAYSLGLKPKNGCYHEGTTFEQIVSLYLFNSNFRQIIFPLIERVEINLRCRISNYFSGTYGVLGYKDSANFVNPDYHSAFLQEIQNEVRRNKRSPFIKHFQEHYENGEIPFYALIEICSFGTLSKFYKNLKNPDKKAIASTYGLSFTYLESWIESIAYVRNLCAHYGRLYNIKLTKTPKLYPHDYRAGIRNNRIFSILCCLKYLLSTDSHWNQYVDTLDNLFQKYPYVKKELMGFSEDWISILKTEPFIK